MFDIGWLTVQNMLIQQQRNVHIFDLCAESHRGSYKQVFVEAQMFSFHMFAWRCFLRHQRMWNGGHQLPERSVRRRISVAFVGIYSHNKDLVDDSLAGCAYIKEASQEGAAVSANTSGDAADVSGSETTGIFISSLHLIFFMFGKRVQTEFE